MAKKKKTSGAKPQDTSADRVPCWDCESHATERLEQMFVDLIQGTRIERGQRPARRTVFLKQHGVAYGWFEPRADLDPSLKIGTFAHGRLPCWTRFSSDAQPTAPDLHSTLGMGLKLFGLPGPNLMGQGSTADFVMQNHDVFFVDDAAAFCEFTTAGVVDKDYPSYLKSHPETARILDEMEKAEASCLTAQYWAILPFAFGKDDKGQVRFVKYTLEPVAQNAGEPFADNNYLAKDLASRLRRDEARFAFKIQLQREQDPLDRATVRWRGNWIHVADVVLPKQDVTARGHAQYGENLAFNIWRTPAEQAPHGSIAAARRVVYQGSADQRRRANGVPLTEPETAMPGEPSKSSPSTAKADDACIVSAAIYPPIGVCRVGNSPDEFYIGPEVPDPEPLAPGAYRDSHGRLKRQAARFRIYGLDALGQPVKELTAENAEIEWRVTIANQKSAWYEFQLAQDIPEAADAPSQLLRNATVSDRAALTIAPKRRTISGIETSGDKYAFDDGEFMGRKVYLGGLRTDKVGRLIVLGGHGVSASMYDTKAVTFANNEGWHDDTSDGPVRAKVTYNGVRLKVDPAWVITAPPNYGPQLKSVRTMYDLIRDVAAKSGTLTRPDRPSFEHDIRPLFERMTHLQWVNAGFAGGFGFGSPFDFSTPQWLEKLNDPSPANLEQRRVLANNFRDYAVDAWSPVPWPWLYGDAMAVPAAHTPRQSTQLTELQRWALQQWTLGNFEADYQANPKKLLCVEDAPVDLQPGLLTQAALEFCLADAFHPGCEMTWPMRNPGMYMAAFRLKHRGRDNPEVSYGPRLDDSVLSLPDGPLQGGQSPGSITRWMAVPWQTDTASCRSGYDSSYDPNLPTFWPARVPNEVLSGAAYAIVMDTSRPASERREAFANRANWMAPLGLSKSYTHQINHMIQHFGRQGVVEVRPGLPQDPDFPDVMQVSDQRQPDEFKRSNVDATHQAKSDDATELARRLDASVACHADDDPDALAQTDLRNIDKVRRFAQGSPRTTK